MITKEFLNYITLKTIRDLSAIAFDALQREDTEEQKKVTKSKIREVTYSFLIDTGCSCECDEDNNVTFTEDK